MIDELARRRPGFREGRKATLADLQLWTLPAPIGPEGQRVSEEDTVYLGLLRVVRDAEDEADQRLSELVLAIHLLEWNYELSAAEIRALFSFRPRSPEVADAQRAFTQLADEHLHNAWPSAGLPFDVAAPIAPHGLLTRLRRCLHGLGRFRRRAQTRRNREAVS